MPAMKYAELASGEKVPALGLGTWKMGVGASDEAAQLRALQAGIAQGMTLLDTAEMYGDGRSEQLVAKAIAPRVLPLIGKIYAAKGVEMRCCPESRAILECAGITGVRDATEDDFYTEYLAPIVSISTLPCVEQRSG